MSDQVILATITAVPSIIAAVASLIIAVRQVFNHTEVKEQMKTLTANTNGKMDQMIALTAKSSRAEGILEEKEKINEYKKT